MTKRNTAAKTAAELTAGSAERIIEDRAPAIDLQDDGANPDLQQPDASDDRNAIAAIFTAFQAAFTDEREFTNPNTGEIGVTNDRSLAMSIITNNFMDQLDYVLKRKLSDCRKREFSVEAIRNGKTGDEDGSRLAAAEAWLERDVMTFQSLVAMRDAARVEFETLRGFRHEDKRESAPARKGTVADLAKML